MRFLIVILAVTLSCAGCAAYSLERRTVNQSLSVSDYRYKEALHCLALVAANPASLPPYALIADGTAQVVDTATVGSQTLWTRAINSFASEAFTAMWTRNPQPNWTIDPVTDHNQLEAIYCACLWVLFGHEKACSICANLLASPMSDPNSSSGLHFDVAWRLERIPPCWFHLGRLKDVPIHACYKAHCHDTWVWVMPEDLEGLSQFTLVLQDIATREPTNMQPPQVTIDLIGPSKSIEPKTGLGTIGERRAVKGGYEDKVESLLKKTCPNQIDVDNLLNNYTTLADSTPLRTNVSPAGGGASANPPPGMLRPQLQKLQPLKSAINASFNAEKNPNDKKRSNSNSPVN